MANTYNASLVSSVIFSNATENTIFNSDAISYRAKLTINVKTTDDKLDITCDETIVQANTDSNTFAYVDVIATIKTTDTDVVIATVPIVSSDKVDIVSNATEEVIDGVHTTVVTSRFLLSSNDSTQYAYIESITESDLIQVKEPVFRHLIMRQDLIQPYLTGGAGQDDMAYCSEIYSAMNVAVVKMSEQMYQTLRHTWGREKILEISAEAAKWGTTFFGEIRPTAKVWEAKTYWYGEKTPVEITPEIQKYITDMMKLFAHEIISLEFERRLLVMRSANELEVASWAIQKHEASEWLTLRGQNGSKTPFLDYLAQERNIDKTILSTKILEKAEEYEDNLSTLLVQMQTILKQFEQCTTVWDLNILYEDYLGIQMPIKQAITLGRTVSETDWSRKDEWRVKGNGYYF